MRTVHYNPSRVTVEGPGGGGFPWEAVVLVLVLAGVAGVAHAITPYLHAVWAVLAIGGTLAGCAVLALAGRKFAQWEKRRGEPEPEVLRWRSGERMRP
jgi:hypothetical protein